MIGKSTIEIKLIPFYFYSSSPIDTTLSDAHNAHITHSLTWMICESPPDMIGYCGDSVGLCALHITYEIAYHYSPLDMVIYTYVH